MSADILKRKGVSQGFRKKFAEYKTHIYAACGSKCACDFKSTHLNPDFLFRWIFGSKFYF